MSVILIANRTYISIIQNFVFQLLSKFFSPGLVSVHRSENVLRQCRLFSNTTTKPSVEVNEANLQSTTSESEDDKLYKRLELEFRGLDPAVLNSFARYATTAAKHLDIAVGRE